MALRPTSGIGFLRKSESGDYLWRMPGQITQVESGGVPGITTQPIGGTFSSPHTFTVVATGSQPITYQWQIFALGMWLDISDTGTYSGTQTANLTVTGPVTIDLRCVVTNGFGQTISDEINTTVS